MRILGIPEGAERPNASQFISTNLSKWFPNMGEQWLEITERTASALRLLVTEIFGRQYAKCSASPTGTKYSRLRGERLSSSRTDRYASPPTSATIWWCGGGLFPRPQRKRGSKVSKSSYSTMPDWSSSAGRINTSSNQALKPRTFSTWNGRMEATDRSLDNSLLDKHVRDWRQIPPVQL